jgi:hypothetical protein
MGHLGGVMPSPTGVSENVRKRKRAQQGKKRKRLNARKGTVNFYNAFATPAADDKKSA